MALGGLVILQSSQPPKPDSASRFAQPIVGNWSYTLAFGESCIGCDNGRSLYGHLGDDYGAPEGTPVSAISSGEVVLAATGDNAGFGNAVTVKHALADGRTVYSLYAHLKEIEVKQGDKVVLGQPIGSVGRTGTATGPHLHLAVKDKPDLGKGYSGSNFTGDELQIDSITYYRPSKFIEQQRPATTGAKAYVAGTDGIGLRLRVEPNLAARVVVVIPEGSEVTLRDGLQYADGYTWRRVQYQGQEGWVASRYLVFDSEVTTPASATPSKLTQARTDGLTVIPPQGQTSERSVVLSATTPGSASDRYKLQFEVRPVGAAFSATTHESTFVSGSSVARVAINGLSDGGYRWRVRVLDAQGKSSAWILFGTFATAADFNVRAALVPVALFSFRPSLVFAGDEVLFTAVAEPALGLSFRWDLGGGQTAQGREVTRVFTASGEYAVSLEVETAAGVKARHVETVQVVPLALREAINRLVDQTISNLDEIVTTAKQLAEAADYFQKGVDETETKVVTTAVFNAIGAVMEFREFKEGIELSIKEIVAKEVRTELVAQVSDRIVGGLFNSVQPQSYHSLFIPNLEWYVEGRKQLLMFWRGQFIGGTANLTLGQAEALTRELNARLAGNTSSRNHYQDQAHLPLTYADLKRFDENSWTYQLAEPVYNVSLGVLVGTASFGSTGLAAAILPAAATIADTTQGQLSLLAEQDVNVQMVGLSVGVLANGTLAAKQLSENALLGLQKVQATPLPPRPTGSISIHNETEGGIDLFGFTEHWFATKAYSDVTVRNTGTVPALYRLDAAFNRQFTTTQLFALPSLGIGERSYDIEVLITHHGIQLKPGELVTLRYEYLGDSGGSIPSGEIRFTLTGVAGDGFYYLGQTSTKFGTTFIDHQGRVLDPARTAGLLLTPVPLHSKVVVQDTGGPYRLTLSLANPVEYPVLTTLKQRLPPDAELLDGGRASRSGGELVWDVDLQPGRFATLEVVFNSRQLSGGTSLPAATLSMRDPVNDRWLTFTNAAVVTQLGASDRPRFTTVQLSPAGVSMSLAGKIGTAYRVDVSSDLTSWLPLGTWTNVTGIVEVQDTNTSNLSRRFYRALVK